jgi:hypothetical protein
MLELLPKILNYDSSDLKTYALTDIVFDNGGTAGLRALTIKSYGTEQAGGTNRAKLSLIATNDAATGIEFFNNNTLRYVILFEMNSNGNGFFLRRNNGSSMSNVMVITYTTGNVLFLGSCTATSFPTTSKML